MHPLDRPVASDRSFEILQKRLGSRELLTPALNEVNRQRFHLPQMAYPWRGLREIDGAEPSFVGGDEIRKQGQR